MAHDLSEMSDTALPKPDIRLAFFDIDGTLLQADGHYAEVLRAEIKRIQALGVQTAIASGRPHFATEFLVKDLGLSAPGVFYSGALVYHPAQERVITSVPLPSDQAAAVIDYAATNGMYCELYTQHQFYVESVTSITELHSQHLRCPVQVTPFSEVLARSLPYKLLLGVNARENPEAMARLVEQFPEMLFTFARFPACPDWAFANVISPEADKRRAFAQLVDYHGVKPENVIAFGDSESDCDFLRLAGIGVAMGNASDSARAAADFVTLSSDEAGVAYALSRLVKSG